MVALRVSHESLQFMMVFKAGSSTFTFHSWFCEVETYFCLESQKHNCFLHVQYGYFLKVESSPSFRDTDIILRSS